MLMSSFFTRTLTYSLNLCCYSSFDWTSIVSFSSSQLVSLTRVLEFLWNYFYSKARGCLGEFLVSLPTTFSVFFNDVAFLTAGYLLWSVTKSGWKAFLKDSDVWLLIYWSSLRITWPDLSILTGSLLSLSFLCSLLIPRTIRLGVSPLLPVPLALIRMYRSLA